MSRNGADLLIEAAEGLGVTTCFANPGTTELHLVDALGRASSMRTVLALFEGVVSGACDGFARMTGTPALGLYHLGPGFANSLANQHNARRHFTPMINLIGDHATWHRGADAPLHSDIDLLSRWVGTSFDVASADTAATAMVDAFGHAMTGTGRTTTIVMAADAAWSRTDAAWSRTDAAMPAATTSPSGQDAVDRYGDVAAAAEALSRPGAIIIAGGARLDREDLALLAAVGRRTGARVATVRTARMEVGRTVHGFDELPYFPEPLFASVADIEAAVLVGIDDPVTFFGYPDQATSHPLPPQATRVPLARPGTPITPALRALADRLGLDESDPTPVPLAPTMGFDPGPLSGSSIGSVVAAAVPEGAIVVSEAITSSVSYRRAAVGAAPHTLLSMLGGAIGGGLPTAVGAAVACPDRPVLAFQADGSALYTIQSLWTMAREALDVTVVICANRSYRILLAELQRAGMDPVGSARSLVDLTDPVVDFSALAAGFGVPAITVDNGDDLSAALKRSLAEPGPQLIEAVMS